MTSADRELLEKVVINLYELLRDALYRVERLERLYQPEIDRRDVKASLEAIRRDLDRWERLRAEQSEAARRASCPSVAASPPKHKMGNAVP